MNAALVVAAVLAAAAAAPLLVPPGPRPGGIPGTKRPALRPRSPRRLATGGLLLILGAVATGLAGRHLALLVVVSVAVLGVVRGVGRTRQERLAQHRRVQVVDYCEALVGELRAGQPVLLAVERAAEVWPDAGSVAAAARLDASVPAAMRRLAELPGAASVRRLAGAWEISASTGSGLVLAVEQVLSTARAEDATARLVGAELASARATARLVTALPVVVLLAAQGIGARPWHFLLDTAVGVGCLGGGVALSLLGLGWIDRIAMQSVRDAG